MEIKKGYNDLIKVLKDLQQAQSLKLSYSSVKENYLYFIRELKKDKNYYNNEIYKNSEYLYNLKIGGLIDKLRRYNKKLHLSDRLQTKNIYNDLIKKLLAEGVK